MKKFMTFAAMAACVAFTSCSNEDDASQMPSRALSQVTVGIDNLNSRAGITATKFTGSESIGLFLFGGTGIDDATDAKRYNIGSNSHLVEPLNIKYSREGDYWTSINPIILSNKKGILYSYYPWAEGNTDPTAIPVKVNTNQGSGISAGTADVTEQTDYMYSVAKSDISNAITETQNLQMKHALAMVSFKFVRKTYPGEGLITRIEIKNAEGKSYCLIGDGTMHIGTGALNLTTATAGSVYCVPGEGTGVVLTDVTDAASIPHMLVYPNATEVAAGDLIMSIKMDGKTYEVPVPATLGTGANYKWEAGNNYVYTLNMNGFGFGAVGSEDITVEITPWTDVLVDSESGNMNRPID